MKKIILGLLCCISPIYAVRFINSSKVPWKVRIRYAPGNLEVLKFKVITIDPGQTVEVSSQTGGFPEDQGYLPTITAITSITDVSEINIDQARKQLPTGTLDGLDLERRDSGITSTIGKAKAAGKAKPKKKQAKKTKAIPIATLRKLLNNAYRNDYHNIQGPARAPEKSEVLLVIKENGVKLSPAAQKALNEYYDSYKILRRGSDPDLKLLESWFLNFMNSMPGE